MRLQLPPKFHQLQGPRLKARTLAGHRLRAQGSAILLCGAKPLVVFTWWSSRASWLQWWARLVLARAACWQHCLVSSCLSKALMALYTVSSVLCCGCAALVACRVRDAEGEAL